MCSSIFYALVEPNQKLSEHGGKKNIKEQKSNNNNNSNIRRTDEYQVKKKRGEKYSQSCTNKKLGLDKAKQILHHLRKMATKRERERARWR